MLLSGVKLVRTFAAVVVAIAVGSGTLAQETTPSNLLSIRRFQINGGRDGDRIVVTTAEVMDVAVIQRYACRLRAWRHTEIRALQNGSVDKFKVEEGQSVKKGDLLFELEPLTTGDQAGRDPESPNPGASLVKVVAPFDGIINKVIQSRNARVDEGDILMSLTDTSLMWAFFDVPETHYLGYMTAKAQGRADPKIGLELGDGSLFKQPGEIGDIPAAFSHATGALPFRADFANPDRILRDGQTGTVLMRQTHRNATVIPRQSAYLFQDKRYVNVVDKDDITHRRPIVVENETDDLLLVKKGIRAGEHILLDWDQPIFLGRKIEYVFRPLDSVIDKSKDQKDSK